MLFVRYALRRSANEAVGQDFEAFGGVLGWQPARSGQGDESVQSRPADLGEDPSADGPGDPLEGVQQCCERHFQWFRCLIGREREPRVEAEHRVVDGRVLLRVVDVCAGQRSDRRWS